MFLERSSSQVVAAKRQAQQLATDYNNSLAEAGAAPGENEAKQPEKSLMRLTLTAVASFWVCVSVWEVELSWATYLPTVVKSQSV